VIEEPGSTDRRTLTVKIGPVGELFDQLANQVRSLDGGEAPARTYEIILQREDDLDRLLIPNNVELFRPVARDHPVSSRETARPVDRDVRQVHDNLTERARLNLVQFETDGRAKRPVVWYDEIDVELPIALTEGSTAPA